MREKRGGEKEIERDRNRVKERDRNRERDKEVGVREGGGRSCDADTIFMEEGIQTLKKKTKIQTILLSL